MITREKARMLRTLIERGSGSLSDDEAVNGVELFPRWRSGMDYKVNDRVSYAGTLYKCLTAHTSEETWTPDSSPSLWVRIDDPAIEWPAWIQPTGSADAYPQGAKVTHNEKHWISDIDGNVWEPGVYGWTEA